jgi:hypothetical protein
VYHSIYHDYYWGTTDDSGIVPVQYGELLNANTQIDVRFLVEDGSAVYGGTTSVSLSSNPYDWTWNYEDPGSGYYERGSSHGIETSGWGQGEVTP